jgi:hypothetical protein
MTQVHLMETVNRCPECGAVWSGGPTCTDHFYLMGAWELDNHLYAVHHMMVLCFYLQHPSLYSPEGLRDAQQLLVRFLEEGITPPQARQRFSGAVSSSTRTYKIKGTPDSYGTYHHPVQWTMTAAHVTAAGLENYYANVRAWADSVLKSLRESGNLA